MDRQGPQALVQKGLMHLDMVTCLMASQKAWFVNIIIITMPTLWNAGKKTTSTTDQPYFKTIFFCNFYPSYNYLHASRPWGKEHPSLKTGAELLLEIAFKEGTHCSFTTTRRDSGFAITVVILYQSRSDCLVAAVAQVSQFHSPCLALASISRDIIIRWIWAVPS